MRIALAGNPNSGKTTMYNALTGGNETVGNWAGVTVDKNEHSVKKRFSKGENIQGLFFPEELEIKEIMYSEADGNQEIIFNPVDQSGCFCITATTNDMYGISSNLPTIVLSLARISI